MTCKWGLLTTYNHILTIFVNRSYYPLTIWDDPPSKGKLPKLGETGEWSLAESCCPRLSIHRFSWETRRHKIIGKMVVPGPLGWGPLNNQPQYTLNHVGIYWGPYPLLKGSNRGMKQLGALHPKGPPPFSLWTVNLDPTYDHYTIR